MTMHEADVAVLGAGPAGCVAARQLGRAGLDVVLVSASAPRAGHATESFPASGAPLADDIGLLSVICEASHGPADCMIMRWRDAPETRDFDGEGPLLIRRDLLHAVLQSEVQPFVRPLTARVRSVTETHRGAEVRTDVATIRCKMVVDARGRHAVKRPATDLVALPFMLQRAVPRPAMWLEALPEGWIWASSCGDGVVHGVLFQSASSLSGRNTASRLAYARRCLSRTAAFAEARALEVGTPRSAGFSAVDDPVPTRRHVRIGDAALARDPIASHGLLHAMRSGVQAAVAVRTMLDTVEDRDAAIGFLRHKHTEATASARRATARAYADQSRYETPFWSQRAERIESEVTAPLILGRVKLSHPLTRAPVLQSDRILWAPAIALPAKQDVFTRLGSVTAVDVATACRPAASLQDIAIRLGARHGMRAAFDVLERLTLGGAFSQEAG